MSAPQQADSASYSPEYQDLIVYGNLLIDRFIDPFFETVFEDQSSFPFHADLQPLCRERNLFGRTRLPDLPDLAYELFQVLPLDFPTLPFKSPTLNLAVGCVQQFFQLHATHNFYHCTVPAGSMVHFIDALQQADNRTFMLPFSAWCDAGPFPPHRHFLLVTPREKNGGRHGWPSAWKKRIREPMHLVNAMGYLSQPKSRCDGTLRSRRKSELPQPKPCQFWILTSLPVYFRLPLAVQWEYGIQELLGQEFRAKDVAELAHLPRQGEERRGLWSIAVRDLPGINLQPAVLPVMDAFVLTAARTDYYLYMRPAGQKLYFEKIEGEEKERATTQATDEDPGEANMAGHLK